MTNRGVEPQVGGRIRELRRLQKLTVSELAARSGLTPGFISQLERDLSSVSLATLARICGALGVTIGQLVDASPRVVVYRRQEQPPVEPAMPGQVHTLVVKGDPRFHTTRSRIDPGAGAGEGLYTIPADLELVYVLDGKLEVFVGDEVFRLERGDALTYSPRDPHSWRNPSADEHADILWVAFPNPYER